ncbi:hypothetical protein ACE2PP_005181 [Salmonella enterica]|nr:hypothetical protein [Salmonella enterica subsp. enterica serovar Santiago]EBH8967282.1 hypothetical protein [Salmonella enterica subsp. enterica serovar Santiago]EKP2071526.1 hypothetical protein [Salmonella enterica]EKP2081320.1 hypothetical protein [Salmonella enterica]EKP2109817.1 hypothetical protein [Salmonella enterica]
MSTTIPEKLDGLTLDYEEAVDNTEKLLGAAFVLMNTGENKDTCLTIIEFAWLYQQAVLEYMRNKQNETRNQT